MTEADLTDVAGRSDATMAGPPAPASPTALDLIDVDVVESYPPAIRGTSRSPIRRRRFRPPGGWRAS